MIYNPEGQSCESCRFWWEYDTSATSMNGGDHVGACRRYPPAVTTDDPYQRDFPDTTPGTWCGEWEEARP